MSELAEADKEKAMSILAEVVRRSTILETEVKRLQAEAEQLRAEVKQLRNALVTCRKEARRIIRATEAVGGDDG